MALLGMNANMRCNGYTSGYHSTRDLVFGVEGSTWTSSNGNSERKNDCYQIGSLPLSSTGQLPGCNKEHLKQIILKHEAIFRDQIHELHRIYQKQRELMDEIKMNELHKQNLRLEKPWSSSSLYYSQNLPWLNGQASGSVAESIQLPLASVQESRQFCPIAPAPTATKESLEDPKLSGSAYRKVGKKILDLQLPADEYIDSEVESSENKRVIKEAPLSSYTSNGISQVNTVEKPKGTNSNGFADLNLPFKLDEETGMKSDNLGGPIHHGNYTSPDMPRRMTLGSHNLPNNFIQNLKKKWGLETCSDSLIANQGKKHGWLSSGINGGDLDSLAKFSDKESQSVPSVSKNLEQGNSCPCFQSIHQIACRPSSKISAGAHDPTNSAWLIPSYASCACALPQLVSESDTTSSGISTAVIRKSIEPGRNLDCRNYLFNGSICNRSSQLDVPSIGADDQNSCDNPGSASSSHELRKYAKGSQDVETHKNINLNVMPAGYSHATTFQSIQITGEENFQDSRFPWLKEKPLPKGKPIVESETSTGCIHSDLKLNKVEESDLCGDKTVAFDLNGKPHTSKFCHGLSQNHWIEEIKKISEVNFPCNSEKISDIGGQVPASEHFMKHEKKHTHKAGIIDLNSCTSEDENTPIDIDLQAPDSPENMECSPPRGESDENQLEMPLQLAGQQQVDLEAQEEQAKVAAEVLVLISGVTAHNGLSSESSVSSPLHWFSGIVSTIVDHSENVVKPDFNGTIQDLEDFLPADFDYFEFMSLNLAETKDLGCCHMCSESSDQNEQQGGSTSPTQPKKCRNNRSRRGKDFQNEILPSLASLSRYEVTEDLQTIGGLVEAARSHSAIGCLRSAGKNVLGRGKRKSCASATNTDLLLSLKQLSANTEIRIEKRGFISWGKICRKRRSQRFPTSKPHCLLSQVYN
ncbi:hypothetical protein RJT34_12367 [Clitoria ternatea]|uniref:Uncharacterized protein n=1 Tax=Clitoria ternatea TaxID=43366 RepID=A0AAN9PLB3_CLITE